MISMKDAKKLWSSVSENTKRLASCVKPHDFSIELESNRWQCSKCKGEVDEVKKLWYQKGILHGSKTNTGTQR